MDLNKARAAFRDYLSDFDCAHEKIKLKIVHTEGVVRCSREIAGRMGLSEEDRQLAELIALLHDIGRFEQVKLYNSFEPTTMDHASFGVELLFGERKMIRKFVEQDTWDDIIREAIARHSLFAVTDQVGTADQEALKDERVLLHAKLIRDADKLDNCRVKLEESIEVLLQRTPEEVGAQKISDIIWDTCLAHRSVRSGDRVTKMDYWVSYIAYFYDINFKETWDIILEQNFVSRIIDRIPYSDPDTKQKMQELQQEVLNYVRDRYKSTGI